MRTSTLALAISVVVPSATAATAQTGVAQMVPPAPPPPPKSVNARQFTDESSQLRCKLVASDGKTGLLQLAITGGRAYPKSGIVNPANKYAPHELDQSPKMVQIVSDDLGVLRGVKLLGSFEEMYEFWIESEKKSRTYLTLTYNNVPPRDLTYGSARKSSSAAIYIQHSSHPTFQGWERSNKARGSCVAIHKPQLPLTLGETTALLAAQRPKARK